MFYEEDQDQLALGYWGLPPSSSTKQRFTEHYWLNIYRSWPELCCTAGLGNYHISELAAGNWNWCKIQAIRWYIDHRRLNIYFKRILDHTVQWGDIRMIFWCIICIVRGNLHCCLVFTLLLCHGVTSCWPLVTGSRCRSTSETESEVGNPDCPQIQSLTSPATCVGMIKNREYQEYLDINLFSG